MAKKPASTSKDQKPAKKGKASSKSVDTSPSPVGSGQRTNVSIRKISNGYLVSQSSYTKAGKYVERETYTPTAPKLTIGGKAAK